MICHSGNLVFMTRKAENNLIMIVLSGLLFLFSNTVLGAERLLLATQLWPPYQTYDQGVMGGIAVERVQCALQRMQQPYRFTMTRWDKAQLLVESNRMDAFFTGSNNASRNKYAVMSTPVINEELTWFIAPDVNLDPEDESAKYQARYGAKFNSTKWLYLKKNGYNVVKKPRDADVLLQMLWQGDLDVALEYTGVFEHSIKKLGIPMDYFRRAHHSRKDLGVHFSRQFLKQNPAFLNTFNSALERCKKSSL